MSHRAKGFTLVEMLIVIVVLGIIAVMALPSLAQMLERRRLMNATELVYQQLQFARMEAVKQSKTIYVNFAMAGAAPAATWSFGLSDTLGCDPTGADATKPCKITTDGADIVYAFGSANYPGVTMALASFSGGSTETNFDHVRGIAKNGTVTLQSNSGLQASVVVSRLGRIRICSPSGTVSDYPSC